MPFRFNLLNSPYILLLEFIKLLSIFRKERYSVIIIQYVSLDGIPAMILKRLFGIRIALFAIGSDVLKMGKYPVAYPIIKRIVAKSDTIFCVSTLIKKSLEKISNVPVRVVPSILDVGDFEPYKGPKEYDIVTIGSLQEEKNHYLLLRACSLLRNPVKLLIIGDGPMREFLESISRKKGFNVKFIGEIPHKQVYRELQKSKIYVHVSRTEGLPVSVLEALYSSLPVILVESPYVQDLKGYGLNFHVSKDDAESLAKAIKSVLLNYDRESRSASVNPPKIRKLMNEASTKIEKALERIFNR